MCIRDRYNRKRIEEAFGMDRVDANGQKIARWDEYSEDKAHEYEEDQYVGISEDMWPTQEEREAAERGEDVYADKVKRSEAARLEEEAAKEGPVDVTDQS
eukprot:TRINITY_DN16304_c0_g1_i3.p1 TRINITY_DN16304_c0_g1~~TRINITY_DN16304_c0_g1_i3.p1  ORF type:complete len:100 (-),score=31.28 TRINITY_DN16304_c0_g1_i3:104-403(-)